MGAGASANHEDDDDDDKPIVHPGLQQLPSNDPNQEAMAAAQWNRILKHTKQQISVDAEENVGGASSSDDANDASRAPKVKGALNPQSVTTTEEQMVKSLLTKDGAAKKRAPNKLAALSADFVHKEHAEEVKTDKQRAHERKKAAAEEARKNYKNTLLHPEEEFVAAKVPTVDATASHSFITSLLSRAAGGRGGRRRDYEEPPEDPNAPRNMDDEDFIPDVELPPLTMQLKSRDHGSITFIYDVDIDAITVLNTIRQPKNKSKIREPLYQFEHRLAMAKAKQCADVETDFVTEHHSHSYSHLNKWCKSKTRVHGTSVTIEGLNPNVMYEFRGCRMQWDTEWGPVITCRTGPGAPSVPRTVRATEVGSNSVLLAWAAPEKDNGLPITEYVVRYKQWIDPSAVNQVAKRPNLEEQEEEAFAYMDPDDAGTAQEVYVDVDRFMNSHEKAQEAADRAWGSEVYRDKPRFFLMAGLKASSVCMFKVSATNLAGESVFTDKICVRTLAEGATDVTPWVMAIDQKTHQVFYMHPRTQAVTWTLPAGVLIDEAESSKNKKIYLSQVLKVRSVNACKERKLKSYLCKLQIERDEYLMQKSFSLLHKLEPWEMQAGPIRINYKGEEGIDAGGLAKDWFVEMSKSLVSVQTSGSGNSSGNSKARDDVVPVDPFAEETPPISFGIVYETEQGVTINPTAGVVYSDEECRYMYSALGMFIAKAIIDGQTIGIQFHKLLLLCLLAAPVNETAVGDKYLDPVKRKAAVREAKAKAKRFNLTDLAETEPEFYRGLLWISENSVDGAEISFSTTYEAYVFSARAGTAQPKQITVELVEGGEERIVTDDDKEEYVQLMVDWLCRKRYEPYISYITTGMRSHLPYQFIQHFSVDELGAMVGGATTIDSKDIQKKVLFSQNGYDHESQQVKWLWSILDDLSQGDLHKFLEFVTGCPSMPVDGLRPPLLLTMDSPADPKTIDQTLPHAHTCFNQLVFPSYTSFRNMKSRFEFALENTGSGFYMS